MSNSLTRQAGLRIAPVVLETLVKHYFERVKNDGAKNGKVGLMQDELLYDAAFNVVKKFLEEAAYHTVEEVQGFSNTRTPSPPWVHVVRLLVPMSSCDEAATLLIQALGGEEHAKRVVGGTKWWQVRGVNGVSAQWITTKKDWRENEKRTKEQAKAASQDSSDDGLEDKTGVYEKEMDDMRCILYSHGGGYYFGSVDQERYSIQRHARKINGRVLAVDYRLAPQYPFPCALHDLLAAYLYLIRPPLGAAHRPVKPSSIVLSGDSAGGGLSLALLQVIRDTGLPMPAGGVLISPWCDFTHSFPSIHMNTATDVIPVYGLSLQKPSTLWPPPSDEMTDRVRAGLRSRIHNFVHSDVEGHSRPSTSHQRKKSNVPLTLEAMKTATGPMPVNVGAVAPMPALGSSGAQRFQLNLDSGETLKIDDQVHLYAQNSMLTHPLISPALSYLGGLPPLLIIASDGEVLRDETIYSAHKAAHPEKYPVKPEAREMYPALKDIESRYGPTPVHLQVYDDCAHVLPVLFAFTTPGKYCFRAIAEFTKHVTSNTIPVTPLSSAFTDSPVHNGLVSAISTESPRTPNCSTTTDLRTPETPTQLTQFPSATSPTNASSEKSDDRKSRADASPRSPRSVSIRRSLSSFPKRAASVIRGNSVGRPRTNSIFNRKADADGVPPVPPLAGLGDPSDSTTSHRSEPNKPKDRYAGDPIIYSGAEGFPTWHEGMIRERVSTQGIIRPLEPESELAAFSVPQEMVGAISELIMRRYIEGRTKYDKKFTSAIHTVEKHRHRHLELAKKDTMKNITQLQGYVSAQQGKADPSSLTAGSPKTKKGIAEGLIAASGSWSWAWALDGDEHPPPSSIVSRRDTAEARRLAMIADQAFLQPDNSLSGNNLWSTIANFLTAGPPEAGFSVKGKTGVAPSRFTSRRKERDPALTSPAKA